MKRTTKPMPTVVYIAGYGRSGSSVVDAYLGQSADIVGVGELAWLDHLTSIGASLCSCGTELGGCEFWEAVNRSRDAPDEQSLFLAIRSVSDCSVVVDSSKTTRATLLRPILLRRRGLDVRLLLVQRDVRAVMFSAYRGRTNRLPGEPGRRAKPGRGVLRAWSSWSCTSLASWLVLSTWPAGRRSVLRYEEFCADPEGEAARALASLGLAHIHMPSSRSTAAGHAVSGSRARRESATITIREDTGWQEQARPFSIRLLGLPGQALMWAFDSWERLLARHGEFA